MSSTLNAVREDITPRSQNLDSLIIQLSENLALMSAHRGYPVKPYSKRSLSTLPLLGVEKKENILSQLETTIKILIAGTEIEKERPSEDYSERRLVEQALDFYGYEMRDEDFWKKLQKDELIEIYNLDHIQIFRTFNFFKTSSYSILDLLINEWFHLWERPTSTLDNMLQMANNLYTGVTKGIHPTGISEHVINEIFNDEDQDTFVSRSSLCIFGIICPIYKKNQDKIDGCLITARVKPLILGQEAKRLSFI